MKISAQALGKKYVKEWIFRHLDATFELGTPAAITGPNGSGKSTLLQLLTGYHIPTEGHLHFYDGDREIPVEDFFRHISIATPYLELIEEFTLDELLNFHFKFKPLANAIDLNRFKELTYLKKEGNKEIRNFSSGMKQRLKLGLCFFTQAKCCFLDEPTSNLDQFGIDWYKEHVSSIIGEKLLMISSNQLEEYAFCQQIIHIPDFK